MPKKQLRKAHENSPEKWPAQQATNKAAQPNSKQWRQPNASPEEYQTAQQRGESQPSNPQDPAQIETKTGSATNYKKIAGQKNLGQQLEAEFAGKPLTKAEKQGESLTNSNYKHM
ncbi:Hypothetical predicted protein [Olea europaea subsp. europaea]|uniref:Uncharacterized protein n=1 Tax=Olea europaea subsp. europaea TaxID=158383 RepID=A0A8S0U578_OLEEU|nr:Hypothetical predicted protein [Olea europaea subsp. europaea]